MSKIHVNITPLMHSGRRWTALQHINVAVRLCSTTR